MFAAKIFRPFSGFPAGCLSSLGRGPLGFTPHYKTYLTPLRLHTMSSILKWCATPRNKRPIPLRARLLSDSNCTRASLTVNQPSMLSAAKQEIGQIAPVLSEFDPNADTTKVGSWGLVYLICGLSAGRSFHWTSTIPHLIPTGYEAFRQSLSGEPSEIQLAIEFRNLISKWAQDPAGLAMARARLADLERKRGKPLAGNLRQYYLDCARLGIMLNSLSDLEIDDLTAIRRWAKEHDQGWPILFYTAGILLTIESAFPSQSVIYGVLGLSHSAKDKVRLLLDHYSHRDNWKSA